MTWQMVGAKPQDQGDPRFTACVQARQLGLVKWLKGANLAQAAAASHLPNDYKDALDMLAGARATFESVIEKATKIKNTTWDKGDTWAKLVANQFIDEAETSIQQITQLQLATTYDANAHATNPNAAPIANPKIPIFLPKPIVAQPAPLSPGPATQNPDGTVTFVPAGPNDPNPAVPTTPDPNALPKAVGGELETIGWVAALGAIGYLAYRILIRRS